MSLTRLQVQVDTQVLQKVKKNLEDKGFVGINAQNLVQIFLTKVANEGVNIDIKTNNEVEFNKKRLAYIRELEEETKEINKRVKKKDYSTFKTANSAEELMDQLMTND